jgi:hypothetical protein
MKFTVEQEAKYGAIERYHSELKAKELTLSIMSLANDKGKHNLP